MFFVKLYNGCSSLMISITPCLTKKEVKEIMEKHTLSYVKNELDTKREPWIDVTHGDKKYSFNFCPHCKHPVIFDDYIRFGAHQKCNWNYEKKHCL